MSKKKGPEFGKTSEEIRKQSLIRYDLTEDQYILPYTPSPDGLDNLIDFQSRYFISFDPCNPDGSGNSLQIFKK